MNRVTYRDSAAEREFQILRSILSEIDKQKESVIENAVTQALTKENSETNVLDDVNGKIEKTSQLANDAMTRFHQKHPEFYRNVRLAEGCVFTMQCLVFWTIRHG